MFVSRTLAERDAPLGRGPIARAVIVAALLSAALAAILTLDLTPGQVTLEVGQVAQRDINAPQTKQFVSDSQTEAAREQAAANVDAGVRASSRRLQDIATAQLNAFDDHRGTSAQLLQQRDDKTIASDQLVASLTQAAGTKLSETELGQIVEHVAAPVGRADRRCPRRPRHDAGQRGPRGRCRRGPAAGPQRDHDRPDGERSDHRR